MLVKGATGWLESLNMTNLSYNHVFNYYESGSLVTAMVLFSFVEKNST